MHGPWLLLGRADEEHFHHHRCFYSPVLLTGTLPCLVDSNSLSTSSSYHKGYNLNSKHTLQSQTGLKQLTTTTTISTLLLSKKLILSLHFIQLLSITHWGLQSSLARQWFGSTKFKKLGGDFGGEWVHACVWLSPFTIHLKLSQHC